MKFGFFCLCGDEVFFHTDFFFLPRDKILKLGGIFGAKKEWFGGRILKNFLICHLASSLIRISGFGHYLYVHIQYLSGVSLYLDPESNAIMYYLKFLSTMKVALFFKQE